MKTAIIHEWMTSYVGSEHVVEQMLLCYPQADLFCLVENLPADQKGFLHGKQPQTSFIQRLPWGPTHYRQYLPLLPLAVEQFDVSRYDLVISSSHAVAKGVLTGPDQLHICMCHSPIRYAWDLQHQYLKEARLEKGPKSWLTRWILHQVRQWDVRTANGVDSFIATSQFIARRIWKTYRRESTVIHPPVNIERFNFQEEKEDFYLTASRMVPYKKVDLIVETFASMPEKHLVVIGEGPDFEKVKAKATANVEMVGYQPYESMENYMKKARAFIFAAEEDFGITPLEAQACGTPVIAYGKGGSLETIRNLEHAQPSGLFFAEQSTSSLKAAIETFENLPPNTIRPAACRANALRFRPERFQEEFSAFVAAEWEKFQNRINAQQREP
jgi:glycosyltransferase involved in cell wall biosynthesis